MITQAFEQSGAPVRLHVAGDGEQAMQFLRRAAASPMPRSGLIVLDLNLPHFLSYRLRVGAMARGRAAASKGKPSAAPRH